MEKLIYILQKPSRHEQSGVFEQLATESVQALERLGANRICLQLADLDEQIAGLNKERLIGAWDQIGAFVSFWLDSEHQRTRIEEVLLEAAPIVGGYLVTEAEWQAEDVFERDGSRRAGISQIGGLKPPASMSTEHFFRHWQEHSQYSFELHPLRDAYTRHTVVRALTEHAPAYRAIVLEHFPSLELFCDDAQFFGKDPQRIGEIQKHTMEMIDFKLFFSGATSEFNFA